MTPSPVSISGTLATLVLIYYGLANLFWADLPGMALVGGFVFAIGSMAVFIGCGRSADTDSSKGNPFVSTGVVGMTSATLYAFSFAGHISTGRLLGAVVGGLAGALLLAGKRQRSSSINNRHVANIIWGIVLFVLMRDVIVDVLTMGSASLEPKIHKGQKVVVTYLSFGVRVPFSPYHIIRWGTLRTGDLVVVKSQSGAPFLREIMDTNESSVLVNVDGWLPKEALLGKASPINKWGP